MRSCSCRCCFLFIVLAAVSVVPALADYVLPNVGDALVVEYFANRVKCFDSNGAYRGIFAEDGLFHRTRDVCFSPDGRYVYVTTGGPTDHALAKYDPYTGEFLGHFLYGEPGPGIGPNELDFSPSGLLYICYGGPDGAVIEVDVSDPDPDPNSVIFPLPGDHASCLAICDDTGNILIGENDTDQIFEYALVDDDWELVCTIADDNLVDPEGLEFGPQGHLYVSSRGTASVLKFARDPDAGCWRKDEEFICDLITDPMYMAFDASGYLYVSQYSSHRVPNVDTPCAPFIESDISYPLGITFMPPLSPELDCNENGIPDDLDIANCDGPGSAWCRDCDQDGGLDVCGDCNGNGIDDYQEVADDPSIDCNGNGVPDECDLAGDINGDGVVNLADLAILLADYGRCYFE